MVNSDADDLLQIFSDPEAMKYYPSTKDRDQTLEWINWNRSNYKKYAIGLWSVELKLSEQFIGQCGLVPQDIEGNLETEIGYLFIRKHWGQGFATEAAQACRDYGFRTLDCSRLISLIKGENKASIRVAEKVGMTFEKEIYLWSKFIQVYSIQNNKK
jgi:RimJ/RimL family protein N-acetyltransferase